MNKKIFITGANGFIGSRICNKLIEAKIDFLGMVGPGAQNLLDDDRYVVCSLEDKKRINSILREYQPDTILHLAAIANPTFGDITKIYDVNVTGSENLLNAVKNNCKYFPRVVLVSTAGVYGNQDVPLLDEERTYNPNNHYSYSKMVMEYLSRNYKDSMDIFIVRPFNMIGYGQQPNFLIPKLVKAFAKKERILKIGNIETERDYVDADFAANVFIELASKDFLKYNTYNICSGIGVKGSNILTMLANITNFMPEVQISSEFVRNNEIWRMVGDPSRLQSITGKSIMPKNIYTILSEMMENYQNEKNI